MRASNALFSLSKTRMRSSQRVSLAADAGCSSCRKARFSSLNGARGVRLSVASLRNYDVGAQEDETTEHICLLPMLEVKQCHRHSTPFL